MAGNEQHFGVSGAEMNGSAEHSSWLNCVLLASKRRRWMCPLNEWELGLLAT